MKIRAKKPEEMSQEFLDFFEKIKHLQDSSSISMEQLEAIWSLVKGISKDQEKTIYVCEIGSHKGFSTAAIAQAISGECSGVWSVDNEMNVPAGERLDLFKSLGIDWKINQKNTTGLEYLIHCAKCADQYDIIFHDAIHGFEAMPEYLLSWTLVKPGGYLIIHDWEQVESLCADRKQIIDHCGMTEIVDSRGRSLAFFRK